MQPIDLLPLTQLAPDMLQLPYFLHLAHLVLNELLLASLKQKVDGVFSRLADVQLLAYPGDTAHALGRFSSFLHEGHLAVVHCW